MQDMAWLWYVLAAVSGYLIGSISFPRIIHRFLSAKTDDPFQQSFPTSTYVGREHGKSYGCIASLLDILKVVGPTVLFLLLFPDQIHHLIAALMAIVGNNYPLYYKFKGGMGYSALLGAIFVINWFGVFISSAAAMILGYLLGNVKVMRGSGVFLLIPWFWIYFNDITYVSFIILANVVFYSSAARYARQMKTLTQNSEENKGQEYWSRRMLMGGKFGQFIDEYGFPALIKKLFK